MSLKHISTLFLTTEEYSTSDLHICILKAVDDDLYEIDIYKYDSPKRITFSLSEIRFLSKEKFMKWYLDDENPERQVIPGVIYGHW